VGATYTVGIAAVTSSVDSGLWRHNVLPSGTSLERNLGTQSFLVIARRSIVVIDNIDDVDAVDVLDFFEVDSVHAVAVGVLL
jgi:hypothetical protein